MLIKAGFDITLECPFSTPMVLLVSARPERRADILGEEVLTPTPQVPIQRFEDRFGNISHRLVAPPGLFNIATSFTISDSGSADPVLPSAGQEDVQDLPLDALPFLHGSRYCETDLLMQTAWSLFGATPPGWARVPGNLRFRQSPSHIRVRICTKYAHRGRGLSGSRWRVPRLYPSGGRALPVHEHSSALLQRVSRRHRRAA